MNNELGGSCDMYGGGKVHTGFWWGNKGKKPFGRPRYRWKDSIEMDLQEMAWREMDWIDLAQDGDRWRAFVIAVMNLQVSYSRGNFLTI